MAYIGETIRDKPASIQEGGIGLMTVPNTQNNTLHIDTTYKDTHLKNINVDTTTTLVATNNYYIVGTINIADTKTWDIATGVGVDATLNVI